MATANSGSRDDLDLLDPAISYSCNLSNDIILKAQKELHEKPEWRQRDLQGLRQMTLSISDFDPCDSDAFLLRFLRAKKFDYDQAVQLLQKYYSARYDHKDIFRNFLPSASPHLLTTDSFINFLKTKDYRGCRVLFLDLGRWKPDGLTVTEILRMLLLVLEKELCNEPSQIFGISAIIDIRTVGMAQVVQHLKPAVVKKISSCLQGSFPIRLKAVHLVHESTLLDLLMAIVKPFLTEKLKQRLYFHGNNISSIGLHMDQEQLPESIGGRNKDPYDRAFIERLRESDPYFTKLNSFGFTGAPANAEDAGESGALRSVFHSYKKICIDGLNN